MCAGSSPGDQGIILETVAAAHAGAASAAEVSVASSKAKEERALDLPRLPVINSCIDRGVLVPGISESAEAEINEQLRSIVCTNPVAEMLVVLTCSSCRCCSVFVWGGASFLFTND